MKTLFDKTTLGRRTLKNRVWRSATWLALADDEGRVTDEIVSTYEELAKGGAAMIVTGLTSVVDNDVEIGGGAKFYDDRFIDGHRRLTDAVHRHGALVMMQTAIVDGPINELSTEQVEEIVKAFGDAARRAEQAGYDGVQIHAAHFFYLSKFISPLCNHRTDRYGGSQRRSNLFALLAKNRARILYEILQDMRQKTNPDFLITMKINSTDEYPGGLTPTDFMLTSRLMAEAGIDAIEVSGNGTSRTGIRAGQNEGYFRAPAMALAAFLEQTGDSNGQPLHTPIVLVGGLRSVDKINQYLNETKIEYVSLSRPLIREPNLINRWQQGDTAPSLCVSCNTCYRTTGHQCIFTLRNKLK